MLLGLQVSSPLQNYSIYSPSYTVAQMCSTMGNCSLDAVTSYAGFATSVCRTYCAFDKVSCFTSEMDEPDSSINSDKTPHNLPIMTVAFVLMVSSLSHWGLLISGTPASHHMCPVLVSLVGISGNAFRLATHKTTLSFLQHSTKVFML